MSADLDIEEMKKLCLLLALKRTHGNRMQAAKLLGVSTRTVRVWIDKFGLEKKPSGWPRREREKRAGVEIGNARLTEEGTETPCSK